MNEIRKFMGMDVSLHTQLVVWIRWWKFQEWNSSAELISIGRLYIQAAWVHSKQQNVYNLDRIDITASAAAVSNATRRQLKFIRHFLWIDHHLRNVRVRRAYPFWLNAFERRGCRQPNLIEIKSTLPISNKYKKDVISDLFRRVVDSMTPNDEILEIRNCSYRFTYQMFIVAAVECARIVDYTDAAVNFIGYVQVARSHWYSMRWSSELASRQNGQHEYRFRYCAAAALNVRNVLVSFANISTEETLPIG